MHFTCLIFKNFAKILGRENFEKSIRLLRLTLKFLNCLMTSGLLRTFSTKQDSQDGHKEIGNLGRRGRLAEA